MTDPNCIFCKIVAGELPAYKVYEDDETLAFLDIKPNNPGHTLVVPKNHVKNIFDTDDETLATVMKTVRKIAPAIKEGVGADGLNINSNHEAPAGQIIFHFHVHVIPRFANDGYKFWPQKQYKEGEAEQVAGKIRAKLS